MKSKVSFALAQHKVEKGNIEENIKTHKRLCEHAAHLKADVVIFPELSLTGYELEMLTDLAICHTSSLIHELSNAAVSNDLTVIAGCPLKSGQKKPYIGAVICHPNGDVNFYQKQYLHQSESDYCTAGNNNYFFVINQIKISLAICADFTEPQHYLDAQAANADVYLVSALISNGGFTTDSELLSNIAKQTNSSVLLSNFISETGGWKAAGKCSVWDNKGNLVVQGSDHQEGLTLCTIMNGLLSNAHFHPTKGT
ncbi:carbon-nitrogen hydrolase family protein [Acinetobacter sp. X9]